MIKASIFSDEAFKRVTIYDTYINRQIEIRIKNNPSTIFYQVRIR